MRWWHCWNARAATEGVCGCSSSFVRLNDIRFLVCLFLLGVRLTRVLVEVLVIARWLTLLLLLLRLVLPSIDRRRHMAEDIRTHCRHSRRSTIIVCVAGAQALLEVASDL